MLNTRIKCGPKKCICSYLTSCLSQINLIIDLFWEMGYVEMYRSMYVSTTITVCHNNRIEATVYYLYVGVVRLGNFTSLLGLVECYF